MARSSWRMLAALSALLAGCALPGAWAAPVSEPQVVRAHPHDTEAFTEGLACSGGFLYEGTGVKGRSTLSRIEIGTWRVLARTRLAPSYFGEGIAVAGERVIQLTWRSGLGFVYDRVTLKKTGEFVYQGEGWGLAFDQTRLIMSDGTATLRILDPATFSQTGRIEVTDDGAPVTNLNELEAVDGEILANVWQTELIARIDPNTGRVTGWLNLSRLRGWGGGDWSRAEVANGIAWDADRRLLFVTGKFWPWVFEVELPAKSAAR